MNMALAKKRIKQREHIAQQLKTYIRVLLKESKCVTDVEKEFPFLAAVGAWPCIPANNGSQTTARTRYEVRCYNLVVGRNAMATTCSIVTRPQRPHSLLGPAMQDTRLQVSFPVRKESQKIQFTLANCSKSEASPHRHTRGMLSCVDREGKKKHSHHPRDTASCQI